MSPFSQLFLQILSDSVWCHGDFMVFQVGIDNFAVCAEQLGWMCSGWWDPWIWWIGVLRMEDEFFRYCRLHCEQWVMSETVIVQWTGWYVGLQMVLDIFSNKWCIQESNRSRNSHRSLELGFLTIGRCSRSHSEGVRSVGCLMARSHCTADGSRTADVVQFYESAWCWIGALIVMTRKVRSFAPVVTDLAAESPHLWWTAKSSTLARIWSPFPTDRRGARPKVSKKIPTKMQKIVDLGHLPSQSRWPKSWRSWKKHESKWCWPALSHAVARYSSNHSAPWRSDTFQIACTSEPLSFSCPVSLFRWHVSKVYVPELVFGHLLTSDNYDDTACKAWFSRASPCFKAICWNINILPETSCST